MSDSGDPIDRDDDQPYDDTPYDDQAYDDEGWYDEEPPAKRRLGLVAAAVVAVVAVGAGVFVFLSKDNGDQAGDQSQPVPPNHADMDTAPELEVTTVVDGLNHPWDVAFTPDGTMLYTERSGTIGVVEDGTAIPIEQPADIFADAEAGMMGLAIDPDFEQNRNIYTCMTVQSTTSASSYTESVVRWKLADDARSLSDRNDILSGIRIGTDAGSGHHVGCRLAFGPDGMLWVTTGDAIKGSNPQDKMNLNGKVLRIDRDGNPAAGNAGEGFAPEVYSYGHRNGQGIAFRPSDGTPFEAEHGYLCDDKVNVLQRGANYGWNPVEEGGDGTYYEDVPPTDTKEFPDAVPAVWMSGCPTVAPSGANFITGEQWGVWDGALAVATLRGTQMRVMQFDEQTNELVEEWTALTDYGRLRTVRQGPDGALYVLSDEGDGFGSILRVVPA